MTLIKIIDSKLSGIHKDRSEWWEFSGYTPNEAYQSVELYRRVANDFGKYNKVPGPYKFFEIRVTRDKTSVLYTATDRWWEHKNVMDRIYWVYQKPVYEVLDGQRYQYYVLEPNECIRVWEALGRPKGYDLSAAFIIPTECTDLTWEDTVAGVNPLIHWRPEVVKSQEQVDKEAALNAEASKLLADGWNVDPNNCEFFSPEELLKRTKGIISG